MIGDIIKEQRTLHNMSRQTIAEGICSEKYIYLIERNERNPSAYILDQLSEKLGIDLFEYYQYLSFKNSILVVEYKRKFERYVKLSDVEKLKQVSLEAAKLVDFKSEPLIYDIEIINCLYEALVEGKTTESIEKLTKILNTPKLNIDPITFINGYIVLSTCYQLEEKLEEAKEVLYLAYGLVKKKTEFPRYHTVIINVLISLNSFLYNSRDYEQLIDYSTILLEFQEKQNEYSRIYYADIYLAFGYYHTNNLEVSKKHFYRGLLSASLFKNQLDLDVMIQTKDFNQLMKEFLKEEHIQLFYQQTGLAFIDPFKID